MKKIRKISLLMALAFFTTLTANAQSKIDKNFSGIRKIDISTASGDCIVKKASGTEVNVKLEHSFGDAYNPVIEQNGDRLVIKEKHQRGSWSGSAKWTITIPDGIDMKYNTGSGSFEASDLELELTMNTGSGSLTLENMKGEISSNSGSGDLELNNFSGEISANVGSGDLIVSKASGYVKLNCGSGSIKLSNIDAEIGANVGSGNIRAREVTLAGSSSFNSGSGDVEVSLNESPKYNISVNSGSGDSELDFNGNAIDGALVMTANKKHGKIVAPFDFDKVEEIDNDNNHRDNIKVRKTVKFGNSNVEIKIGTGSGVARVTK